MMKKYSVFVHRPLFVCGSWPYIAALYRCLQSLIHIVWVFLSFFLLPGSLAVLVLADRREKQEKKIIRWAKCLSRYKKTHQKTRFFSIVRTGQYLAVWTILCGGGGGVILCQTKAVELAISVS